MENTLQHTPNYVLVAMRQFIGWVFFGKKGKSIIVDFFVKAQELCHIRKARRFLYESDRSFCFLETPALSLALNP